jgi:hypothetical protein
MVLVFVTSTIDAKENREVVTINIPGAFLHATNDDYVIMQMNGTLAKLMAKMDPMLYRKYLVDKKGKKVLYLRLQKALYGMMKNALLFYQKLVSELKSMGFGVNPYDPCIAIKIVDGHQLTLRWHVDDLMISHVDMSAINDFLRELKVIYDDSLTESTGKQHNYLGMIFDFSSKNEVQINMNLYISKIIKEIPEEIIGKTSPPAGDHLFKIREEGRKLDDEMQKACWLSSRQYATFLGACCFEVTI